MAAYLSEKYLQIKQKDWEVQRIDQHKYTLRSTYTWVICDLAFPEPFQGQIRPLSHKKLSSNVTMYPCFLVSPKVKYDPDDIKCLLEQMKKGLKPIQIKEKYLVPACHAPRRRSICCPVLLWHLR
jgi:hypothetical protein